MNCVCVCGGGGGGGNSHPGSKEQFIICHSTNRTCCEPSPLWIEHDSCKSLVACRSTGYVLHILRFLGTVEWHHWKDLRPRGVSNTPVASSNYQIRVRVLPGRVNYLTIFCVTVSSFSQQISHHRRLTLGRKGSETEKGCEMELRLFRGHRS